METIFINIENSKLNNPFKYVLNLSQGLDFRGTNKKVAPQNRFTYKYWKNTRQEQKNNELKIISPKRNGETELPDGSYSVTGIQDYLSSLSQKK